MFACMHDVTPSIALHARHAGAHAPAGAMAIGHDVVD